jgi:hypothetical protein
MKKRYIFICLCFVLLSSNLTAQVNNDGAAVQWKTHKDSVYNFIFKYPTNWEFKLPATNTRFFVTSYKENETDRFRENVNCIARKLSQQNFVINDAEEEIKKSLSEKLKDYHLISSGYIKWNNTNALQLNYTLTQESDGETYYIRMFQQIAVVKGNLYTLTFTSEADSYDKYEATVKKIYQSFKVN